MTSERVLSILFRAAAFAACASVAVPAAGQGGAEPREIWEATLDGEGGSDFARAIAVVKRRAIAAGYARVKPATGPFQRVDLVAAYRAGNGRRLWMRLYETGRLGLGADLPHDRRRVYLVRSDPAGVEALFARSGRTAWVRDEERAPAGAASAIGGTVLGDGTLFTGGTLADEAHRERAILQALDARSGAVLWERWEPWSDLGPGGGDGIADLDHAGGRLAAVGVLGFGLGGRRERTLVAAYDGISGDELWRRVQERTSIAASTIAATRESFFIAGGERSGGGAFRGLVVQALAAADGAAVWEVRPPGADPDSSYLVAEMAVQGHRLVVAGTRRTTSGPPLRTAFVVVLDPATGEQRWYAETEITDLGSLHDVVLDSGRVDLVGDRRVGDGFVRALELGTGATLWEIASDDVFGAAIQGTRRLFTAGAVDGGESKLDFAVRGYRLAAE